jgi:hypothetical protein
MDDADLVRYDDKIYIFNNSATKAEIMNINYNNL